MPDSRTWKSKESLHEGFPLLLRYPIEINVELHKSQFPELAIVVHDFLKTAPNGLPEPDYNDGLFDFDRELRCAFEEAEIGSTILVETFAGKRRYYIYIAKGTNIADVLASVCQKNPGEKISWNVRPDPEWTFIRRYRREILNES